MQKKNTKPVNLHISFVTLYHKTWGHFFHSPCTRTFTQNVISFINWLCSDHSLYLHILGAHNHAWTAIWAPWTTSQRLLEYFQVCRSTVTQAITEQNCYKLGHNTSVVSHTNLQDHRMQYCEINLNVQIHIYITFGRYSSFAKSKKQHWKWAKLDYSLSSNVICQSFWLETYA